MLWVMGYPFGQFGSAVPGVSPSPNFLPIPSLLATGTEWGERERLDPVGAFLSNSQNSGVLLTLF